MALAFPAPAFCVLVDVVVDTVFLARICGWLAEFKSKGEVTNVGYCVAYITYIAVYFLALLMYYVAKIYIVGT